jgi:hypothetical protein
MVAVKIRARGVVGVIALVAGLALLAVPAAGAASTAPWWHLSSSARPTVLPSEPGGKGEIVVTAVNLGDAVANGEATPIVIEDRLPTGLKLRAGGPEGIAGANNSGPQSRGPVICQKVPLSCSFKGTLPPYDQIEIRIKVETLEGAHSGEMNEAGVSGGGTPAVQSSQPVSLSAEPTPFGVDSYELAPEEADGTLATQAGSHPFQLTTRIELNEAPTEIKSGTYSASPVGLAKDIHFHWPPGLIGNPVPIPRCSLALFLTASDTANDCPAKTAVGVAMVAIDEPEVLGFATLTVPIFNLEPAVGQPARFGFFVPQGGVPVIIDPSLHGDEAEAYAIDVSSTNITQTTSLTSVIATVWGVPNDPRHDSARGWTCLAEARGLEPAPGLSPCLPSGESHPPAFLIMPTSCSGAPLQSSVEVDSWLMPHEHLSFPTSAAMPTLDGCDRLLFSPHASAEISTDKASAPSGLDFNLDFHDEGLTSGEGLAESQLKDTVVTLPEGLTINPSAGVGLGGCTRADYARETLASVAGEGCPDNSKLGTVEVTTPLLSQPIHGSLYIAQPYENPFSEPGHANGSLVALYVVLRDTETGILIKLAGKVTPNPVTGQLTTSFENNPQVAFDHFNFHFREGQQAPLISPPTCGTYTTQAQLTPWSDPAATLTATSSFAITKGFDGGACPAGGVPPFAPSIQSGMINNNAGAFSPFYLHLTRTDAEQEISGFSTDLPPGLTGDLTGIPFCPEASIALARSKTGAQEETASSCPAASQVGRSLVGTGVGAVLAYVPGKVYLAGPYSGDPFSLVSVTSAVVGPFDLGTVVIRFGLRIDPHTAQVSVDPSGSEPIPTILDGIVTHVRDIRVYVDRPNFTLNPTSCEPLAISSTLKSDLGHSVTVSSPFQATNCANLGFKPIFKVSTNGRTSRKKGASLTVNLSYPSARLGSQANIAKVKVDLPKQLPSRLPTLQKACPARVFNADPAGCPSGSIVGHAKAITPILPVPLQGPAYFVSHGGEAFPNLIIVLQGYGVRIDLIGDTFINEKTNVTSSTFNAVPDQPVTSFELTLPQGEFSALAANTNLCKLKHGLRMPTVFTAQNGAVVKQSTPIAISGCPKHKAKKKPRKAHRAHHHATKAHKRK